MRNVRSYDEFIKEEWFNFFNPKDDKKITNDMKANEMKAGQIVSLPSDKENIVHVFQLVDPKEDKAIFVGNFKLSSEKTWMFKLSRYLRYDLNVIKGYRHLNEIEKKMFRWYFSSPEKIENLKNISKLQPIF